MSGRISNSAFSKIMKMSLSIYKYSFQKQGEMLLRRKRKLATERPSN
jgi:hypothetical protein